MEKKRKKERLEAEIPPEIDITNISGPEMRYILAVFGITYDKFSKICRKKTPQMITIWGKYYKIPEAPALILRGYIGNDNMIKTKLAYFRELGSNFEREKAIKSARFGVSNKKANAPRLQAPITVSKPKSSKNEND